MTVKRVTGVSNQLRRVPADLAGFKAFTAAGGADVVVFGADIAGKVIMALLRAEGVGIKHFLDNNRNKCGVDIDGVPVMHASSLPSMKRETIVLIASTYIGDIVRQIEELGFFLWVPIARLLQDFGDFNPNAILVGPLRQNHSGGEFSKGFDSFVLSNMINSQEKYLDRHHLYIRSVDLIVTERCSLKCKDCSNLMQYYEAPQNIGISELETDLEDLCAVADEVNEIRVIGGDPLMNKDFHLAAIKAASFAKVNKVVIYTNGTIAPAESRIEALAAHREKVFVFVTTYGGLSRRVDGLVTLLEKHGVPYNCQSAYGWTDCASVHRHERSEDELRRVFQFCCAKHFTTLTDGKIFRCPFSANVERLRAIASAPDDYVDLRGVAADPDRIAETKARLWYFLREKSYIEACKSCNGRTYGDPEITPGIQTSKPLPYRQYERV